MARKTFLKFECRYVLSGLPLQCQQCPTLPYVRQAGLSPCKRIKQWQYLESNGRTQDALWQT